MATTQQVTNRADGRDATTTAETSPHTATIDPGAAAGSKNSVGTESVRDGRPTTDDGTVEAIDEATPGIPPALSQ